MAREDYQPTPQQQYPDLERMVQLRRLGYLDQQALLRSLNRQRMLQGQNPAGSLEEAVAAPPGKVKQTEVPGLQIDPRLFAGRGSSVESTSAPQDSGYGSALASLDFGGLRKMFQQQSVPMPRPRPAGAPQAPEAQGPQYGPPQPAPRTRLPLSQQRPAPAQPGQPSAAGPTAYRDISSQVGLRTGGTMTPQGLLVHHTSGVERDAEGVADVLRQRGLSVQFVIDKNGQITQLVPDGRVAFHGGSLEKGGGKWSNSNMEGVEVIARNEQDVNPAQRAAIARLTADRSKRWGWDPKTSVWGHGELTGRKETDEGSTARMIREGRMQLPAAQTPAVAPAGGQPAASGAPQQGGTRATWFHTGAPYQAKPGGPTWPDPAGQREGAPASRLGHNVPGIATPGREGLGEWHEVTLPDGRRAVLQKTDVGPGSAAQSRGVGVDINAAAAAQLYPGGPQTFPSGSQGWSVRRLGRTLPEGTQPGLQPTARAPAAAAPAAQSPQQPAAVPAAPVAPPAAAAPAPAPAVAPRAASALPSKTGSLGAFGYRAEHYGGDIAKANAYLKQHVGFMAPSFSPEKGGPQQPGAHIVLPPEAGGGTIVVPGATSQQMRDYHGKALQYIPGLKFNEGGPQAPTDRRGALPDAEGQKIAQLAASPAAQAYAAEPAALTVDEVAARSRDKGAVPLPPQRSPQAPELTPQQLPPPPPPPPQAPPSLSEGLAKAVVEAAQPGPQAPMSISPTTSEGPKIDTPQYGGFQPPPPQPVQTTWEPSVPQAQSFGQPFGQGNMSPIPWDWMQPWGWGGGAVGGFPSWSEGFAAGGGGGGLNLGEGFAGFNFGGE